ncbi:MAG: 5-formyltetrahydrofolate cyclo-ligase [Thermoplasmatota archaeon]|nr:5-formyltetrahydrofolate cyclo-ligase [Halobacteriales archaeon]
MADLAADKADLRRRLRAAVAALPPARRALEEEVVQAAIQADPAWRDARRILLYRAVPPEFSVVGLTLAAWREGKRTFFPRVAGAGRLTLHEVASWDALRPGSFGIPEPPAETPEIAPGEVDVALVPGVGWDAAGHRLGRGGGFYDRLIPRLGGLAWGVGFACQRVPRLPRGDWDAKVARTWLATDFGVPN